MSGRAMADRIRGAAYVVERPPSGNPTLRVANKCLPELQAGDTVPEEM